MKTRSKSEKMTLQAMLILQYYSPTLKHSQPGKIKPSIRTMWVIGNFYQIHPEWLYLIDH